jgi:hypothetical protein
MCIDFIYSTLAQIIYLLILKVIYYYQNKNSNDLGRLVHRFLERSCFQRVAAVKNDG